MNARLRRPGRVATVPGLPDDNGIPSRYVALLPNGPMIVIASTAALIWEEADTGEEANLPARVAARLGNSVAATEIDADVRDFVDQLVDGGFLERYDAPSGN